MGKSKREKNKHPVSVKGESFFQSQSILILCSVIALAAVFVYFPTMTIDDSDIWFHLKYGEHFVENHTWHIDHSIFSWTQSDPEWKYVSWAGDVFLYYLYHYGSITGFYVLQWLVLISIVCGFLFYVKRTGLFFDINLLTGILLVLASLNPSAIYIKPEMLTLLFFSVTVFIYIYSKSTSKSLFYLYPLIFLVWVNIHGGFILGLFLISLFFTGELVNFRYRKEARLSGKQLKIFLFSLIASYIAVQINPYGIQYLPGLVKIFLSKEYARDVDMTTAYVSLWKFLVPQNFLFRLILNAWTMIIMFAVFLFMNFSVYKKKKHFDAALTAANILFFFIGMSMTRASLFFPVIWLLTIVHLLRMLNFQLIQKRFAPVSLALFLIVAGYFVYFGWFYLDQRTWFGRNFTEIYPVKEAEFIKVRKLPGPIFCDYDNGSYLLWALYPDYKVFIDSRYGPYVNSVWPDYADLMKELNGQKIAKFISKYPFRLVVTSKPKLIGLLLSSPEWRLLYFERSAAVIGHASIAGSGNTKLTAADMGAERFTDINTPSRLLWAFWLYFNSGAMKDANEIINIYKNNISDSYKLKAEHIRQMEKIIMSKGST